MCTRAGSRTVFASVPERGAQRGIAGTMRGRCRAPLHTKLLLTFAFDQAAQFDGDFDGMTVHCYRVDVDLYPDVEDGTEAFPAAKLLELNELRKSTWAS
jgi:hypothetical protein